MAYSSNRAFVMFFWFVLFCAILNVGRAQDLKFYTIGADKGLSQSAVNCVIQDQQGFMWFGTQEGLNRYDGNNFKIYKRNPLDSNSLSNNFVYCLLQDKTGKIWIGTAGGGVNVFDPSTERFTHFNHSDDRFSLSNDVVRVIYEDQQGTIWIGTDEGLNEYDPKNNRFVSYTYNENDPHSLPGNRIFDIREDKKGHLWIGTYGKGICRFDKTTRRFSGYQITDADIDRLMQQDVRSDTKKRAQCNNIRTVLPVGENQMWIGTDGGGILVFNTNTNTFEQVYYNSLSGEKSPYNISNSRIFDMEADNEGNIWLAVYGIGVEIYHPQSKTFTHYLPNENDLFALKTAETKCIYKDNRNNFWIGTNGKGLHVYFESTSLIQHLRHSDRIGVGNNTLLSSEIMSIVEDRDGLLWIGTLHGGLSTLDRNTGLYTHYPELSTSTNNSVTALIEATNGTIWIGTYGDGVISYDKKTSARKKWSTANDLIAEGTILSIAEDEQTGSIWFGTFGAGLYRLDPETDSLTQFTAEKSNLSSNFIYTVFYDSQGTMWVGTRGGGLMQRKRNEAKFQVYKHDEKKPGTLSNNTVYCISEGENHTIWVATANGLNRLNADGTFSVWYENDGLPSDNIYAILQDNKGQLWLSHNKGITRFDTRLSDRNAFRNFGAATGVQPLEFNQGAYFKNKAGELFFGGQGGLNIIRPDVLEKKRTPPPVYLVSYKKFGFEVKLDSVISYRNAVTVTWRDNNFQFEVAALDYVDPSKNVFQVKLEGFDDDWAPVTSNRFVSYTNLPGGTYTLRVRAADSNGNWNDTGISLSITVTPPWWRTNLFYAVSALIIVAGIFIFIRLRTAGIKRENKILEQKVNERTRELAQKNADITSSIKYARRIQLALLPEVKDVVSKFSDAFVLYRPKDIVSGDFYWHAQRNGWNLIAVADCTGHGVPGALMSMIGHNLLEQIVNERGIISPDEILLALNEGVRNALRQHQHEQDTPDGMDIAICAFHSTKPEVRYAAALRPLIIIRNGSVQKIEPDRLPIGGHQESKKKSFKLNVLPIERGDCFYLFSDGYADQFGGEKGKKFMQKRLLELLQQISHLSMNEQSTVLSREFENWKGTHEQIDDLLVVGIRQELSN